jgi:hypothetical protein
MQKKVFYDSMACMGVLLRWGGRPVHLPRYISRDSSIGLDLGLFLSHLSVFDGFSNSLQYSNHRLYKMFGRLRAIPACVENTYKLSVLLMVSESLIKK